MLWTFGSLPASTSSASSPVACTWARRRTSGSAWATICSEWLVARRRSIPREVLRRPPVRGPTQALVRREEGGPRRRRPGPASVPRAAPAARRGSPLGSLRAQADSRPRRFSRASGPSTHRLRGPCRRRHMASRRQGIHPSSLARLHRSRHGNRLCTRRDVGPVPSPPAWVARVEVRPALPMEARSNAERASAPAHLRSPILRRRRGGRIRQRLGQAAFARGGTPGRPQRDPPGRLPDRECRSRAGDQPPGVRPGRPAALPTGRSRRRGSRLSSVSTGCLIARAGPGVGRRSLRRSCRERSGERVSGEPFFALRAKNGPERGALRGESKGHPAPRAERVCESRRSGSSPPRRVTALPPRAMYICRARLALHPPPPHRPSLRRLHVGSPVPAPCAPPLSRHRRHDSGAPARRTRSRRALRRDARRSSA